MAVNPVDRREVVMKMDGGSGEGVVGPTKAGRIWRESSDDFFCDLEKGKDKKVMEEHGFEFDRGAGTGSGDSSMEDPPSKLMGQFLHKQKASDEVCLDMDLEMAKLQNDTVIHRNLAPVSESPTTENHRVSFDPNLPGSSESVRRRNQNYRDSPIKNTENGAEGEASKCSSINDNSFSNSSSFNGKSSLPKERTKSGLMDPPPHPPQKWGQMAEAVGRSGHVKFEFLGKGGVVEEEEDNPLLEEEDDPLLEEDLLEWVSLALLIAALVCSLLIPYLRDKKLWKLRLWEWLVLVLVLICGRLVSGWAIRIIVFFIKRNFLLRKRVLYFVYEIKKAVQNCLLLGLVLIAWHFLFERETGSWTLGFVTKILECSEVSTLLWLLMTLMVKLLASSFHVSTYFDRIQESLFNQYVIKTLSVPLSIGIKKNEEEEEKTAAEVPKSNQGDEGITIDHLHKLNSKNVSARNMEILMNIILFESLSTLDEQTKDTSHEDVEPATKIGSEVEAKAAARKIFQNVAKPGSRDICLEDIKRFLQEDKAIKAMSLFEGASESNKVSEKCLENWVVNAFRDRRALASTLNNMKTAVNKLHLVVNILVGILIINIWLLILGIASGGFLVVVNSLLTFIFKDTCKTVFEAIIFLFVIHPLDVGDLCEIDGVKMVVEEMNILKTVFRGNDNEEIIYENSVLATKSISNYYRRPNMGDAVEFLILRATAAAKITLMKQRINSYIENKKEHWRPAPMIIFKDMEELNRVRISVRLTHTMNHRDMEERWSRRSLLVEEMVKILKELDIEGDIST